MLQKTIGTLIHDILNAFMSEKPRKKVFGNYRIEGDELIYQAAITEEKTFYGNDRDLEGFLEWSKDFNLFLNFRDEEISKESIIKTLKAENYVRVKAKGTEINVVAKKIKNGGETVFLGNSSILPLIGRTVAYGNESRNTQETEIQRIMSGHYNFFMIPFSVFTQAGLNIEKFKMIQKGPEKTVLVKQQKRDSYRYDKEEDKFHLVDRHFTGAALFEVDGVSYLFDIDRREIQHKIFNPFLAKLNSSPKTIKEAYESLKPKEVLAAEKKGIKVLRQGEWFFIETSAPKIKKLSDMEKLKIMSSGRFGINSELAKLLNIDSKKLSKEAETLLSQVPRTQNLQAGNSRPNSVELLYKQGDKVYCSGVVKHSGREHADLKLNGWFLAVPNTSIQNFTITGDID